MAPFGYKIISPIATPKLKFPCTKINSIGLGFLYNFLGIRTVGSIVYTFLDISSHNLHISLNQEIWIFFQ